MHPYGHPLHWKVFKLVIHKKYGCAIESEVVLGLGYVIVLCVGTLESGYIRNIPLPRIPQIQSTSQVVSALTSRESNDTCYLWVAWIPTWRKLSFLPEGFGTIPIVHFFPLVG